MENAFGMHVGKASQRLKHVNFNQIQLKVVPGVGAKPIFEPFQEEKCLSSIPSSFNKFIRIKIQQLEHEGQAAGRLIEEHFMESYNVGVRGKSAKGLNFA